MPIAALFLLSVTFAAPVQPGAAPGEPSATSIDPSGRVDISTSDDPFVPIGLYCWATSPDVVRKAAAAGFNCITVMGQGDQNNNIAVFKEAQRLGIKVLVDLHELYPTSRMAPKSIGAWKTLDDMVTGLIGRYHGYPALLGWSIGWMDPTLEPLTRRYQQVRQLDREHLCLAAIPNNKLAAGAWRDGADVLAPILAPVPKFPLAEVGLTVGRALAAAGADHGVWVHLQAYDRGVWDKEHAAEFRAPTLDEMRTMTLAGLAAGANGVMVFGWDMFTRDKLGFEARWRDVAALAGELKQLLPGLTSPEKEPDIALHTATPEKVFARAWRRGHDLWLVAANGDDAQHAVTFRLPAGAAAPQVIAGKAAASAGALILDGNQSAVLHVTLP
jgi:hypothetical protein